MAGAGLRESQSSVLLVTCLPVDVFLIQQELVNQKECPYMCAYKLVTVKFKWWGLQNKVENFIHKVSDQVRPFQFYGLVGGVLPKRRSYNPCDLYPRVDDIQIFQFDFPDPHVSLYLTVLQFNTVHPRAPHVTGKETEAKKRKRKQEEAYYD